MILYHGTNADFDRISLTIGLRYKDFHDYDIVIGPIANDGVVLQLTNYREGIYSPEEAARLLQDRYLDQQYYFGTERAVRFLRKTNVENV